jgi:hypothetical protein
MCKGSAHGTLRQEAFLFWGGEWGMRDNLGWFERGGRGNNLWGVGQEGKQPIDRGGVAHFDEVGFRVAGV